MTFVAIGALRVKIIHNFMELVDMFTEIPVSSFGQKIQLWIETVMHLSISICMIPFKV